MTNYDEEPLPPTETDETVPEGSGVVWTSTTNPTWSMGFPQVSTSAGPIHYFNYHTEPLDEVDDVDEDALLDNEEQRRVAALIHAKGILGVERAGTGPFDGTTSAILRLANYILTGERT